MAFSLAQFLTHTMFISVLEVLMHCRRKLDFIQSPNAVELDFRKTVG